MRRRLTIEASELIALRLEFCAERLELSAAGRTHVALPARLAGLLSKLRRRLGLARSHGDDRACDQYCSRKSGRPGKKSRHDRIEAFRHFCISHGRSAIRSNRSASHDCARTNVLIHVTITDSFFPYKEHPIALHQ